MSACHVDPVQKYTSGYSQSIPEVVPPTVGKRIGEDRAVSSALASEFFK